MLGYVSNNRVVNAYISIRVGKPVINIKHDMGKVEDIDGGDMRDMFKGVKSLNIDKDMFTIRDTDMSGIFRWCDKQFSNKMKNVKFSLFFNLFRGLYRTLKVLIVNKEIFTKIRSMGR